jgi:hypothetical protein
MSQEAKPRPRAPYTPPSLRPMKLFVEAVVAGCCRVSLQTCSDPMRAQGGGGQGKTQRPKTSS